MFLIQNLKKLIVEVDLSGLVKKKDYDAKIVDILGKYITTSDYNRFTSDIHDAKTKQVDLLTHKPCNISIKKQN